MQLSSKVISEVLFDLDPLSTCCKENDCFDEYDFVARHIAQHIEDGLSPRRAIFISLSRLFSEDAAKNTDLEAIVKLIQKKQESQSA